MMGRLLSTVVSQVYDGVMAIMAKLQSLLYGIVGILWVACMYILNIQWLWGI